LGNDTIIGSSGADNLFGGAENLTGDGDDTVNSKDGVNGNDSLDGGSHVSGDTALTDAIEKVRNPHWRTCYAPAPPLATRRSTHPAAYLSNDAICSVDFYAPRRRERLLPPAWDRGYARSCIRTSENKPSPTLGE
jgi:hypothetical protein